MKKFTCKHCAVTVLAGAILLTSGCVSGPSKQADAHPYRDQALAMMKRDFQSKGIAGLERLDEDAVQSLCNATSNNPSPEAAAMLQKDMMASIKLPADGQLMGDHVAGEKLAQNGRGFTWNDKADQPAGGNCYNCHQLSPKESSFGSIGPSLYNFGKIRGNTPETQKYVYSKIYNAKAYHLCSEMPRFGYIGALKESQIKDLVALLLDPESPVNK